MKTKAVFVSGLGLCLLFMAAYLPAGESRLPGVRVLGSLSEQYEAVTFDHEKHVSISGTCERCHHHGEGKASLCKDCHGLSPSAFKQSLVNGFLSCSNCHGAYNRDNPSMPGLKVAYHITCFECHRGMGNIGVDPSGCTELCHARKTGALGGPSGARHEQ